MTVFMSLILILRKFTEMGLLSKYDLFMSLILILRRFTEMGFLIIFKSPFDQWNDYVVICIKIYNFKANKKYDGLCH